MPRIINTELVNNSQNWEIYFLLREIVDILYSPIVVNDSLSYLANMISSFLQSYCEVHGSNMMKPKFHFMIHYPQYIRLYGSLRNIYCFPFEKKHQYFKNLIRIVKNFINITYTLSTRHQLLFENIYGDINSTEIFSINDVSSKLIKVDTLPLHVSEKIKLLTDSMEISVTSRILIDGLRYFIDSSVVYVLCLSKDNYPIFFALQNILYINEVWYFGGRIFSPEIYISENMLIMYYLMSIY